MFVLLLLVMSLCFVKCIFTLQNDNDCHRKKEIKSPPYIDV